jgi:hypothetical protein
VRRLRRRIRCRCDQRWRRGQSSTARRRHTACSCRSRSCIHFAPHSVPCQFACTKRLISIDHRRPYVPPDGQIGDRRGGFGARLKSPRSMLISAANCCGPTPFRHHAGSAATLGNAMVGRPAVARYGSAAPTIRSVASLTGKPGELSMGAETSAKNGTDPVPGHSAETDGVMPRPPVRHRVSRAGEHPAKDSTSRKSLAATR